MKKIHIVPLLILFAMLFNSNAVASKKLIDEFYAQNAIEMQNHKAVIHHGVDNNFEKYGLFTALEILKHIGRRDIPIILRTSKLMHHFMQDKALWRHYCQQAKLCAENTEDYKATFNYYMKPSLAVISLDKFDDGYTDHNECFLTLNDMADNGKLFVGCVTARLDDQNHGILYVANADPITKEELIFLDPSSLYKSTNLTLISGNGKIVVGRELKNYREFSYFVTKLNSDGTFGPIYNMPQIGEGLFINSINFYGNIIVGTTHYHSNLSAFICLVDEEGCPERFKLIDNFSDTDRNYVSSISGNGKIAVGTQNSRLTLFDIEDCNLIYHKFDYNWIVNYLKDVLKISKDGTTIIYCMTKDRNSYVSRIKTDGNLKVSQLNKIFYNYRDGVCMKSLNSDGNVIVGCSETKIGHESSKKDTAIICVLDHNNLPQPARSLESYLNEYQVPIPVGYKLVDIHKVNGNGCLYMGVASILEGDWYNSYMFTATLPLNSDF